MATLLTPDLVRLGARAADKRDAIAQAGQLLVDAGRIQPGYLDSLAAREAVANTYLGSGVAIPHGMPDDRHLIRHTGIAILQLPAGVEWQPGEQVRLVFAIAAQSDEHIGLLQRLTRAIGDPQRLQAMIDATDPARLIALLEGEDDVANAGTNAAADGGAAAARADGVPPGMRDFDERIELVLDYPSGLHARPASAWVATAKRQQAELRVRVGTAVADPTSLIGLLQLGAVAGATLVISARGERAGDALAALRRTIEMLAVEEHERAAAARARQPQGAMPLWQPLDAALTIAGLGVGPGMTLGRVRVLRSHTADVADTPGDLLDDTHRLDAALAATDTDLVALVRSTTQRFGASEGEIFEAQRGLVRHTEVLDEVARALLDGHGLGWAWHRAMERQALALASAADPLLAGRAADIRDVARRVLMHIDRLGAQAAGADEAGTMLPAGSTAVLAAPGDAAAPAATILLAEDLTPSDTAALDPATTLGFCTVAGGPTSHTAILARTLGVPAAVACGPQLLTVADGAFAVLDGTGGRLHLNVSDADLARARTQIAELAQARERAQADRALPARTQDGQTFEIGVNVTRPEQVRGALDQGADGVGLMRTEFLFLERQTAPDEDEQYATYRALVEASGGRHLIIRTLDIGGDKQVPYLNLPHETNPFLGVRGLRLCLRRPDLFIPQLRALYRAAMHGPLWIMFPMVSTLDEARRAVALAETVRAELDAPRVPLGIMVETPSAAVLADLFAEIVDFFSIGTNDLTQYTLAIDREHPEIAAQADSLHPAVLRLIRQTVDGARRHAKWVGVCGGLAGDPLGASILAGFGVDELSMSASDIGAVKARLRASHGDALRDVAARALACGDVAAVRALPLPPLAPSSPPAAAAPAGREVA
ncbi:MAG: phosphoenolpyruvate--protein phosphotransferase [Janthinobacterium lividum]